jgi:hypothetical protein
MEGFEPSLLGSNPSKAVNGAVDQWQSQLTQNQHSVGSNPTRATINIHRCLIYEKRFEASKKERRVHC